MAESKKIAGARYLSVGGTRLAIVGSVTVNTGGDQRSSVIGEAGPVGAKSTTVPPHIEATCFIDGAVSAKALTALEEQTVVLGCKNGRGYALRGGFFAGDGNIDISEGTMVVRFEGLSCEEITL